MHVTLSLCQAFCFHSFITDYTFVLDYKFMLDYSIGISTSKGSYRSLKKIVKVWMMMMKEGIFAGHPSLALLALASPALAPLALNALVFARLHSPLPRSPL